MTRLPPQPSHTPDAVAVHHLPLHLVTCRRQVWPDEEVGEDDGDRQPIRVRREGDRFVILFGHRQWRASKLAGCRSER